jgi:hypothetical protein
MSHRTSMKSILLLAANPKGTKSLRLQEEEREIKERLRLAGYGKIPINSAGAVRPIDIQQAMLDFDPHVVHFSGHGAGQDGLVFEDAIGQEKLVDSEALAQLFELFAEQVECVVLNACYSKFQAEAIAQYIDYVIGMSKEIGDNAAIKFSVGFYAALGAGRPFKFAYKLGCNAIRLELERSPEYLTPIIWERGQLLDISQNNLTPKTQILNPRRQEEGERQQPPQQPTPKIPSKSQEETDELASEKGVDYTKLRDLLAQGYWKELESKQVAPVSTPPQFSPHHILNTKSTLAVGAVVALTLVALAGALVGRQYPFLSSEPQVSPTELSLPTNPTIATDPNSTATNPNSAPTNQTSTVGVDYTILENLLAQGKWKEADKETGNVMLKVAGGEKDRDLIGEDIEKFPCTDLRTIDTLWVKYSKGRFGFSVQKRIWESVGVTRDADGSTWSSYEGSYERFRNFYPFGDRIKWRENNDWLDYEELTFSVEKAPEGHLPIGIRANDECNRNRCPGEGWRRYDASLLSRLFSRVETCKL